MESNRTLLRDFLEMAPIGRSTVYARLAEDPALRRRLDPQQDALGRTHFDREAAGAWAAEILDGRAVNAASRAKRLGRYAQPGKRECHSCGRGMRKQTTTCPGCGTDVGRLNHEVL